MTATVPTAEDFPAAHSMDAIWFAVDGDGHIGVFDSGEAGAVPAAVKDSIEQVDHAVIETLVPLPVIGEPELELSAVFDPGLRSGELPWRRGPLPSGWPWEGAAILLLFQDESVLTSEVRALPGLHVGRIGEFVLVTLKPDVKLTIGDPRRDVWREFERVASAAPGYVTSIYLNSLELALARRGVFPYAIPDARLGLPEPYRKTLAPQRPLVVDKAPNSVRDRLTGRARLEVSFASSPYVQPAELIPCTVWGGDTYLGSDGCTIRPLPGAEAAAYREQAALLLSRSGSPAHEPRYKPLVFDPPLPTNGHFPAAHSMDATWFAVDRDGHIGVFDSGEAGAVPAEVNNTIGQSDDEVLEALEPLPVIGEPRFELSGMFHPGLRSGALPERRVLPRGWPFIDEVQSLLLWDESLLTPEVRALPGLEVDRAGQFVLVSLKPTIELAQNDPRWTVWDQFKRVVYKTVIDLTVHLPELKDVLSRALRANIETEIAVHDVPCAIKVDPNELRLALLKLAINARDAMPNGGTLSIAVRPVTLEGRAVEDGLAGEFVAIRVADTGVGIPADVLPLVFAPYSITEESSKVAGSGLSQAYGFARQSGGTATITSAVGQGTVITLYLPRSREVTRPFCISSIGLTGPELAVARRGLFAYSAHDARFNRPGPYDQPLPEPYGLVLAPKRPLRLDEAARPLRNVLATRTRLNIVFASSPYVQPAELVPSVAWGEGVVYLASDGCTIRPFPATQAALYVNAGDLLRSDSSQDESRYKPLVFDPRLDQASR